MAIRSMMLLSAPVVFYFGRIYFVNAWKQARIRKSKYGYVGCLSTGIAFFFSAFNTFFPEFWHNRGIHSHVYFEAAAGRHSFYFAGKTAGRKSKIKYVISSEKINGFAAENSLTVIAME